MSKGKAFILMGVSSTGKTSVGTAVANQLGLKMIDGDDLHPRAPHFFEIMPSGVI